MAAMAGAATAAAAQPAPAPDSQAEYLREIESYAAGQWPEAVKAVLARRFGELIETQEALFARQDEATIAAARMVSTSSTFLESFQSLREARVRSCLAAIGLHAEAMIAADEQWQRDAQYPAATAAVDRLLSMKRDLERHGPVFDKDYTVLLLTGKKVPPEEVRRRGLAEWETLQPALRQWFLVAAPYLHDTGATDELDRLLEQGLKLFDDDPELLLARGSLRELSAARLMVDESLADRIYEPPQLLTWRRILGRAAADFKRSRERAPELVESALRFGRVRQLLGDEGEAAEAFGAVDRLQPTPFLAYLSRLFRAELAETAGDLTAANQRYRECQALMPLAQAPAMALSRLGDAGGDDHEARRWLQRSFAAVTPGRKDPWWEYPRGQRRLVPERLARLRQLVSR
jgi:hypothetical protein